jgi:hypothetical protein
VIEYKEDGRNTGHALVFLKSKEEVNQAKEKLNKSYVKHRYIEFCPIRLRGD